MSCENEILNKAYMYMYKVILVLTVYSQIIFKRAQNYLVEQKAEIVAWIFSYAWADPEGDRGPDPLPEKSQNYRFLSNNCPDSL